MKDLLKGLQAIAETTRLRILSLCAHCELTVSELVTILDQSQPRVSRHLKLLMDAGVLDRSREGNWVYYRVSDKGPGADLARQVIDLMGDDDPETAREFQRLGEVKDARTTRAMDYFRHNAAQWDSLRQLHVDAQQIEQALVTECITGCARGSTDRFLDLGTGTGRLLELLAPHMREAVGLDRSREMLAVAEQNLRDRDDFSSVIQLRHGDIHDLPFAAGRFDLATLYMVLHYLHNPKACLIEAGRVLAPGGRLALVDFAPHARENLRDDHAHVWLGFDDDHIAQLAHAGDMTCETTTPLEGGALTVKIWWLRKNGVT